jgi:hypothetical protein
MDIDPDLIAQLKDAIKGLFPMGLLVIPAFVLFIAWDKRCPQCKRWWALRWTGRVDRGRWYESKKAELKCKHCGHSKTQMVDKWWQGPPN